MKIGVLIDGGRLARWQADALLTLAEGNRFVIYDCTNSRSKRRPIRHGLYYLMNLASVRNPLTASVGIPEELAVDDHSCFAAESDRGWERLPSALLERVAADRPDVIVKFGMGLLRIPPDEQLACPILSYHHGDPRHFRGRPAGFYELLTGATAMGQIVQRLSNSLDAGTVVAFAETKLYPHSWRQTLVDAYRASPLLLRPAIANALDQVAVPIEPVGTNYRLPSNATAARMLSGMATKKLRRLGYGAFVEKRWRVAEVDLPPGWSPEEIATLPETGWRVLPLPRPYRFLADPFYATCSDELLVEAMRPDGAGEILAFGGGDYRPLPVGRGHASYPCTLEWQGRQLVMPEISDWSPPRLYELRESGADDLGEIAIDGAPRLFDATLHVASGGCFLFGNRADESDRVLRLWVADSPFGPFSEHCASPIRISPAGARMGGAILTHGPSLYRAGQDLRRAYGDGLILFRIERLSRDHFGETEAGRLRFKGQRGPHTINIRNGKAVFDYYDDQLSPLAGFRRLRQSRAG